MEAEPALVEEAFSLVVSWYSLLSACRGVHVACRFIFLVPFSAIAISATMAPRIQIYTQLVCDVYKPEFKAGRGADKSLASLLSAVAHSSYMLSAVTSLDGTAIMHRSQYA